MRQRVVIAIAMANNPKLIIADEPTTALDVTIQAQILDLIATAQRETGAAVIMITHDMGVVAKTADDVLVMYAGKPVEQAPVRELFHETRMPYSIGLLGAIPRVDKAEKQPLVPIKGNPPLLINLPDSARSWRCPIATEACRTREPELRPIATSEGGDHRVACVRADEIENGLIGGLPVYPVPELPTSALDRIRAERAMTLDVRNMQKTFPLTKGAFSSARSARCTPSRG
jgi:peptide/nickel transport system ATP-binding protein